MHIYAQEVLCDARWWATAGSRDGGKAEDESRPRHSVLHSVFDGTLGSGRTVAGTPIVASHGTESTTRPTHGWSKGGEETPANKGDSDRSRHSLAPHDMENGEGGIRTPGTGVTPYDGLANRCFQPLSHLSKCSIHKDLRSDSLPVRFLDDNRFACWASPRLSLTKFGRTGSWSRPIVKAEETSSILPSHSSSQRPRVQEKPLARSTFSEAGPIRKLPWIATERSPLTWMLAVPFSRLNLSASELTVKLVGNDSLNWHKARWTQGKLEHGGSKTVAQSSRRSPRWKADTGG